MLLREGGGGQYIFGFGQASNGESKDVNHTQAEFFSQAVNKMQV